MGAGGRMAFCAVLLAAVVSWPGIASGATFVVRSTADTVDATPGDGVCADAAGACTLRAAIVEANQHGNDHDGPDRIHFDIAGAGPHTIEPQLALPFLTDTVVIDGLTQCGAPCASPALEVTSPHVPQPGAFGIVIVAGNSLVRGLAVSGFSENIGTGCSGGVCPAGITIEGNYVGLDTSGAPPAEIGGIARPAEGWCCSGIIVRTSDTTVRRNVVGGVSAEMIAVQFGSGSKVEGNFVGTNPQGTGPVPGGGIGISVGTGASGTMIGGARASEDGPCDGACNLVARGMQVNGADNLVRGNFVGTNEDGTAALDGFAVPGVSGSRVHIGGTDPHERNLILGGISVDSNAVIEGNFIGTDLTGTRALGDAGSHHGISVGVGDVRIGGTAGTRADHCAGACNLISGNAANGLHIQGFRVQVEGNFVGTDVTGTLPLGNRGVGVAVAHALTPVLPPQSEVTVAHNTIAFNGSAGVVAFGSGTAAFFCPECPGVALLGNRVLSNDGLGIDLQAGGNCGPLPCEFGPTANDPGDSDLGANDLQNFPVITGLAISGGTTRVTGFLDSRSERSYHLEFFRNASCDSSGFGEGEVFAAASEHRTDATGRADFNVELRFALAPGETVTATATDTQLGYTSEFSECTQAPRATVVVRKATEPRGDPAEFEFIGDVLGKIRDGETIEVVVPAPSTYTATEVVPAGWDVAITCDDADSTGAAPSATATFRVVADERVTCTFTNTKRGKASVVKTVNGSPPSGTHSFTFQLRSGASTTQAGTILETRTADAANGGIIDFATLLVPGTGYALCEFVMPGWMTTLGPPSYVVYNPSGDNSVVCTDFTVQPGQAREFAIDNKQPPGGFARTIGFWKNWASCANSSGNQRPVLDQTLALAEPGGIRIGDLVLHAGDCVQAVRILNKSRIDTGKKMSSDPAFNLAAQLLAAKLNVVAGAGTCPAAVTAINEAQALLDAVNVNGITHATLSAAQSAQANTLATTLDRYNNNLLC